MAVTFATEIITTRKLYMRCKGRRHLIDRQIEDIQNMLKRWDNAQAQPTHAYIRTLDDCLGYGGQPFLEARGVVIATDTEEQELVHMGAGKPDHVRTFIRRTYTVTNEADVKRCLQELIDIRDTLIGKDGTVREKELIKH